MKRILLVTDVYGWGGHVRAEYIKKHLSDEFYFDIMDGEEFGNRYKKIDHDLIYLLFHTQLLRKDVKYLLNKINKPKIITCVTSYPTLRAGFINGVVNKKQAIQRFLELANQCVAILANNNISLKDLKLIYKGPTYYACRGVDENVFYPTRQFKEKPKEFTVVYVGKPTEEKGLHIIEPACKKAGVKLISNTRNYTNALNQDQMRDFYNQGDVYAVASKADGTPNPALEAAACGLPLVANYIGNMPELIVNHKNGWLVERSIERYVNKFIWLKKNQKAAWEIGQKGRQSILKDWTWDNVLNKNERMIFREILK
jgi:glycosyltransferase involved in cell wall biosynthesis